MRPRVMYSESISQSPLLTVIEESGVPSCMRFLSPDVVSHDNNSSVGNQRFPASNNAATGKKQAPVKKAAPAKNVAKATKGGAKEAKTAAAKIDDEPSLPPPPPPPPPPPSEDGMGLATVATEAAEAGTDAEGAEKFVSDDEPKEPVAGVNECADSAQKTTKSAGKCAKKAGGNLVVPSKASKTNLIGKKVTKDAGKNVKNVGKKTSVIKEANEPADPEPNEVANAKPANVNEESAAGAGQDAELAHENSLPVTKDAKKAAKDSKGKSAKNGNDGKNSKSAKTAAKTVDKKVGKSGAKNAVQNQSAVRQSHEAANAKRATPHGVPAASNAHMTLINSSETETFDAASSDSVGPVASVARRLAAQQATGESADVGRFSSAAVGPPVDGTGEKAAPPPAAASLDSSTGSPISRQHQPALAADPSSPPDANQKQLANTESSSRTEQASQEEEEEVEEFEEVIVEVEETLSADSNSVAAEDVADLDSQESITETTTSELLEDGSSQSLELQEQQQRADDRERLERIKAEAVVAVRKFFAMSKRSSSAAPADVAETRKATAHLGASATCSRQQQREKQQSKSLEVSSCPMHVQISEKALELFELLETAFNQRRKHRQSQLQQQRQRSSTTVTTSVQNSANSSAADGGLRDRRPQQSRRRGRRRHCDRNDGQTEDGSRSAASATLSEAVIQEVEFEEATEEDEDEAEVFVPPKKSSPAAHAASSKAAKLRNRRV